MNDYDDGAEDARAMDRWERRHRRRLGWSPNHSDPQDEPEDEPEDADEDEDEEDSEDEDADTE